MSKLIKLFLFLIICSLPFIFLSTKENNIEVTITQNSCQLIFKGKSIRCDAGRNGASAKKIEGDGKTPIGTFNLREVFYRADKISNIKTKLPIRKIQKYYGWCDDSKSDHYNHFIHLPPKNCNSSESLYRIEDDAYDIIVPMGFNDKNIIKGKGSAIFLHVFKNNNELTAGCIAIDKDDLLELLENVSVDTKIIIKKQ
ncbi:MAG: L,D-peptidoglycan transpeptidase YkuD (ErfK/YbiS/YcfS/YnhG family) [Lentimonas sp.]|jgi:L,D-peptidoglycan transpeptidase YkuD (ErfK/YbiS/YcfS/YnhG family)